jgi:hypothetical protein
MSNVARFGIIWGAIGAASSRIRPNVRSTAEVHQLLLGEAVTGIPAFR